MDDIGKKHPLAHVPLAAVERGMPSSQRCMRTVQKGSGGFVVSLLPWLPCPSGQILSSMATAAVDGMSDRMRAWISRMEALSKQ